MQEYIRLVKIDTNEDPKEDHRSDINLQNQLKLHK